MINSISIMRPNLYGLISVRTVYRQDYRVIQEKRDFYPFQNINSYALSRPLCSTRIIKLSQPSLFGCMRHPMINMADQVRKFSLSTSIVAKSIQQNLYPLAEHCPLNYESARKAFIEAAHRNKSITELTPLKIGAKGPNHSDLFIDIAVMGNLSEAEKVLFHISGTHGIEAGPGSGIQHAFLSNSISLGKNVAIVFIHTLNPFGMAFETRGNEDRIDLNRNCSEDRITPELYKIIDPLFNPKTPKPFDWDVFNQLCSKHGWSVLKDVLAQGQYHYPQGLFYGGREMAEGPRRVFEWCKSRFGHLTLKDRKLRFGIIDVHSGLGPYAVDTLLTIDTPTPQMLEFFGEQIALPTQTATAGYQVKGTFTGALENLFKYLSNNSALTFSITQEFGTIPEKDVMLALYKENMLFHHRRSGAASNPEGLNNLLEDINMLKAFYPEEREWRHRVVSRGRKILIRSLDFLDYL